MWLLPVVRYDVNVVCVNADQLPVFAEDVGSDFFRDRYSIGVWFWEAPTFPVAMHGAFDWVDEVWVASEYVADAISGVTSKPVRIFPLPVEVPAEPHVAVERPLGLPDSFMFFFSFDFLSVFERKNPLAIISAFTSAFADGEGPILVIKSINGDRDPRHLQELKNASSSRQDIHIVDTYLSSEERNALMASCDCYVSLHRSEGFGFTMAEAMAAGKPVIATAHGGNTTFMTAENSVLVPFELISIPAHAKPYPIDGVWADPDVEVAADFMRRVYRDPDSFEAIRIRAREDIQRHHSPTATGEFMRARLEKIRVARAVERVYGLDLSDRAARRAPALVRAEAALAGGVGHQFVGKPDRGRPITFVRRVLRRILWPFLAGQNEIDRTLIDVLRDLDSQFHLHTMRIADLERRSDPADVAAIDDRLALIEARLAAISERSGIPTGGSS